MTLLLRRAAKSAASLSKFSRSAPENPGVRLASVSQRDFLSERLVARVHFENLLAAFEVGAVDDDLAVEPSRPQQRRIENVGAVGRSDQNDAGVLIEPVHLDEELVERLLALVVSAAEAGAALAADGVDLVDEDDARRRFLRLIEEIADARGSDADEHLDEIGAGDRQERHARLACDRAREQRLTGAGRPEQQHAFGNPRAERLILLGILQEVDDLGEFLFRLVDAGDVGERDLRAILRKHLGARAAERQAPGSRRSAPASR